MKKYTSVVWKVPKAKLIKIVNRSITFTEVLLKCGLTNKGGNIITLRRRLLKEHINFSHIPTGRGHAKGRYLGGGARPTSLTKILVKESTFSRNHLKARLLKEKYLIEKCAICGMGPVWNKQKLSLQLDHVNSKFNDNRLVNLRLLCPNCHTQTEHFAGRNSGIV